jgi:hypothetical protein
MSFAAEVGINGYAPTMTIGPAKTYDIGELPERVGVLEYKSGDVFDKDVMRVNTKHWKLQANVRNNIKRFVPQMASHVPNEQRVCIVGGGWSINRPEVMQELRDLYFDGAKIVALNGAANWLVERNIRPSMHIVMDARPCNTEFVKEPIKGCKYFLASQVDPGLFDLCEDRDTYIFHVHAPDEEDAMSRRLDAHYMGRWTRVPPAGSVGIVGPILCRMLGFYKQDLFGIDSCCDPTTAAHHGYSQPWNDSETVADFVSMGKRFKCTATMAAQAQTFIEMIAAFGQEIQMTVHGDGLIHHMVETALRESDAP